MWSKEVKDRTFGFEIEFGDADKSKILMPKGYSWTDNELSRMHNSDGTACTHSGRFGGEINTRPFKHTEEDLQELRDHIQSIKDAGGYLMWNEGFDAHFYIKDLPLDTIKLLFECSYWVAPYLKKIFDLAEWFENKYIAPSPDYSYVEKMNKVQSVEEIPHVFANASHRGHIRFYLNFVPVDRIGTMEFRIFNSSWDWEKTYETIKFMYNYVDFVVKNPNVEAFKAIDSIEKCVEAFNINVDNIPKKHKPLLWASEHNDFMTLVGSSFSKSRSMVGKIFEVAKKFGRVHVVNSYYTDLEQVLTNDHIMVYTKNLFIKMLYDIALNDATYTLTEPFGWIELDKGSKAERIAKLMLFEYIKKTNNDDFYHQTMWEDYKRNYTKYVAKYAKTAEQILKRLESKHITLIIGDVLDAIENAKQDGGLVIYQSEFNQSLKSVDNALAHHTGIEWEKILTPYSKVDLDSVKYLVITKMKYMFLPKIYRNNRTYLYSNVEDIKGINKFTGRPLEPLMYKKLPDDHAITKNSKLQFIQAKMSEVDYLRAIYMKKDILLGSAPFNYLWFIDGYLIGASMFDYSKQAGSGGDKIWMKSDFVIDSNHEKLSKLLIMAVLSKEFKEELDIRYRTNTEVITTTVFTNNSVSMKYRGVYKLAKRESGKLYYEQEAGKYPSLRAVMHEHIQKLSKK